MPCTAFFFIILFTLWHLVAFLGLVLFGLIRFIYVFVEKIENKKKSQRMIIRRIRCVEKRWRMKYKEWNEENVKRSSFHARCTLFYRSIYTLDSVFCIVFFIVCFYFDASHEQMNLRSYFIFCSLRYIFNVLVVVAIIIGLYVLIIIISRRSNCEVGMKWNDFYISTFFRNSNQLKLIVCRIFIFFSFEFE